MLLSYVAKKVLEKYPVYKENIVISSRRVYYLEKDKLIQFEEPFDFFNEAVELIYSTPNYMGQIGETVKMIKEYYDNSFFDCEIFPVQFARVQGYFCLVTEENIYILFFSQRGDENK